MHIIRTSLENILTGIIEKEEIDKYLISLIKIRRNRFDIEAIKECISLFKKIYNMKKKISKETYIYLIKTIVNTFKIDINYIIFGEI